MEDIIKQTLKEYETEHVGIYNNTSTITFSLNDPYSKKIQNYDDIRENLTLNLLEKYIPFLINIDNFQLYVTEGYFTFLTNIKGAVEFSFVSDAFRHKNIAEEKARQITNIFASKGLFVDYKARYSHSTFNGSVELYENYNILFTKSYILPTAKSILMRSLKFINNNKIAIALSFVTAMAILKISVTNKKL